MRFFSGYAQKADSQARLSLFIPARPHALVRFPASVDTESFLGEDLAALFAAKSLRQFCESRDRVPEMQVIFTNLVFIA